MATQSKTACGMAALVWIGAMLVATGASHPASASEIVLYDNIDLAGPGVIGGHVYPTNPNVRMAQPFFTGMADNVSSVTLKLSYESSRPTGSIAIEIWDDDGSGRPGESVGTLGTIDVGTLTASYDLYTVEGEVSGLKPNSRYFVGIVPANTAINASRSFNTATVNQADGTEDAGRYVGWRRSEWGWEVIADALSEPETSYLRMKVTAAKSRQSSAPQPADGATDVHRDAVLSWTPGDSAAPIDGHIVYFSENFEDVNNGIGAVTLSSNSYDPGRLGHNQVYYWRVDDVNGAPDFTVHEGNVWRFTVEPFSYLIENITATASSSNAEDMGPEKTVDGSGLNELGQHSITATDMWLSAPADPTPWIRYDFDKVYKLDLLSVWNANQLIEPFLGFGARDIVIETSVDGAEWTVLEGATLFNQAPGTPDYLANTDIDLLGSMARHVRITVNGAYGAAAQTGISEVAFLSVPVRARQPEPAPGELAEGMDLVLNWRAGREAVSHQVHFSSDRAAVAEGAALVDVTNTPSYDLSAQALALGSTYFWRVDEVNEAAAPSLHMGDVWSFSTPDHIVVDDFEQYNDHCNRIFFAWEDGFGHKGSEDCDILPSSGNGGGAAVGYDTAPFAEKTIVNVDSTQSLPLSFDNSLGQSEITLTLAGQDWTAHGIRTLSLFFYGKPSRRARQLYIKINDIKLTYDGDPTDTSKEQWLQWQIDLTPLAGLENVTTFSIGVDGNNAKGVMYFDDIWLYP